MTGVNILLNKNARDLVQGEFKSRTNRASRQKIKSLMSKIITISGMVLGLALFHTIPSRGATINPLPTPNPAKTPTRKQAAPKINPPTFSRLPKIILRLLRAENYKELEVELKTETSNWNGRRAFLLGYANLKMNHPQNAVSYFKQALQQAPALRAHILHFSARSSKAANDDEAARKALENLVQLDSRSIHTPDALETLAGIETRRGEHLRAANLLSKILINNPSHERAAKILVHRAKAFNLAGRKRDAAISWRRIWTSYPESPEAERALKLSEELAEGLNPRLKPFGPQDYFLRARKLQKGYHYDKALKSYRDLSRNFPNSTYQRDIKLYESLTLYSLRKTEDAKMALERAIQLFPPNSPARAQVRYYLSRNNLRRRDQSAFEMEAKQLLEEAPRGMWAGRTRFLLARVSEDDLDYETASYYYREILKYHSYSPNAPKAQWQLAWISFRTKNYLDAYRNFNELRHKYPNHKLISSALYWGAVSAERAGEREKAEELYRKCIQIYRHRYYGQLSADALRRIGRQTGFSPKPTPPPTTGHKNWLRPPKTFLGGSFLKRWRAAELLSSMGFHKLAAEDFKKLGASPYFRLKAARSYLKGERHDMAIKIMHESFWDAVRSGGNDLPIDFWEIAFPIHSKKQKKGEADPLLVNAIIRAESLFDRRAFSRAGAIGLMQLMPATGKRLSKKIKIRLASKENLFDPDLNVRLGARYLGDLVKEFNGALVPAIASYNAGKRSAKRWWDKRGDEPIEVFIEKIPYRETRNYVKKVLGYLREYRRIYGKLKNTSTKKKRME
jgi:soluble lytic murein transglycosylase